MMEPPRTSNRLPALQKQHDAPLRPSSSANQPPPHAGATAPPPPPQPSSTTVTQQQHQQQQQQQQAPPPPPPPATLSAPPPPSVSASHDITQQQPIETKPRADTIPEAAPADQHHRQQHMHAPQTPDPALKAVAVEQRSPAASPSYQAVAPGSAAPSSGASNVAMDTTRSTMQPPAPALSQPPFSSSTTAPTLQQHPEQPQPPRKDDSSGEHLTGNRGDPLVAKWTSSFWRQTGKVQAAVGELMGIESWQTQGRSTEAWADNAYCEAEHRSQQGEPSWVQGEYDVVMGTLGNAMGYLAGDPEMQARARMRVHEGQDQVSKINRQA